MNKLVHVRSVSVNVIVPGNFCFSTFFPSFHIHFLAIYMSAHTHVRSFTLKAPANENGGHCTKSTRNEVCILLLCWFSESMLQFLLVSFSFVDSTRIEIVYCGGCKLTNDRMIKLMPLVHFHCSKKANEENGNDKKTAEKSASRRENNERKIRMAKMKWKDEEKENFCDDTQPLTSLLTPVLPWEK